MDTMLLCSASLVVGKWFSGWVSCSQWGMVPVAILSAAPDWIALHACSSSEKEENLHCFAWTKLVFICFHYSCNQSLLGLSQRWFKLRLVLEWLLYEAPFLRGLFFSLINGDFSRRFLIKSVRTAHVRWAHLSLPYFYCMKQKESSAWLWNMAAILTGPSSQSNVHVFL